MRVGECCALTWEDVDFENRTIRVDKTQIRLNKKRGGERDMSNSSLPYISDTGRVCGMVSDFLFFSSRNRILTESTVRQIILHITLKKT